MAEPSGTRIGNSLSISAQRVNSGSGATSIVPACSAQYIGRM